MANNNIQNANNLLLFEDTLAQCISSKDILDSILFSKEHFQIYRDPISNCINSLLSKDHGEIIFLPYSTLQAVYASKWMFDNEVAVLDFASPTTPGGGVLIGSKGQEEDLCRTTSLYFVLNSDRFKFEYYNRNKCKHEYTLIEDITVAYIPQIRILKDQLNKRTDKKNLKINVIVCAAPNLRKISSYDEGELEKLVYKRACRVFESAIENQCKNIILGAHGCGAFKNPVSVVGKAYARATEEFKKYFDTIIFAIPDKEKYDEFKEFFVYNSEFSDLLFNIVNLQMTFPNWKELVCRHGNFVFLSFDDDAEKFFSITYQDYIDKTNAMEQQLDSMSLLSPKIRTGAKKVLQMIRENVVETRDNIETYGESYHEDLYWE